MHLRIHHFFDIVRDLGSEKTIAPHPYQHSYHLIADKIRMNPGLELTLVLECDDVCHGCIRLQNHHCTDTISHRTDFVLKEDFNNHIDRRIMDACELYPGRIYSPAELVKAGEMYLLKARYIYAGNDEDHTAQRIEMVKKGLKKLSKGWL